MMMSYRRGASSFFPLLLLITTIIILSSSHPSSSAIAAETDETHHHSDTIIDAIEEEKDSSSSIIIDSIIDNDEEVATSTNNQAEVERMLDHDSAWPTYSPTTRGGDKWSPPTWSKPTRNPTRKPTWNNEWRPTRNPTRKPTWNNEWTPTRKPTWNNEWKPTRKPTWRPSQRPSRKPTPKPTLWNNKPTQKPTWKSGGGGGSNNNDGDKYRIYTRDGNPVGYSPDGWDTHFWWRNVIADVRQECAAMLYQDLEYVAKVIRLSFHDCKGRDEGYGCDGCVNLNHIDNFGLEGIMQKLRPIVERFDEYLSRADTWILCALTALEISTSRTYPMTFIGRKSCEDSDYIGNGGEYGDVYGDEVHTYQLLHHFNRYFGFDTRCTVAVMGVHGISKMRPENSGHGNGPHSATWVKNASYRMSNAYYEGFESDWTYEERDNDDYPRFGEQYQWYNGPYVLSRLVLLNVDVALKWNYEEYVDDRGRIFCKVSDEAEHHGGGDPRNVPECPRAYQTYNYVREYADNYGLFLNDLEYCMIQMYTTGYRSGYDGSYYQYYGDGRASY